MEYRILGKTDLRVSILGYGAAPLGDVFGVIDLEEVIKAVRYAIDNGVNFFDVSPFYGKDGLAETRLGEALKDGLRNKVILATKVGQYNFSLGSTVTRDYSEKSVIKSIDKSLKRLRTNYIDIYQAHDICSTTIAQVVNETIPAMVKLKEQGKIRYIGITDYNLKILKTVAEQAEIDTILTFGCYNLVDTSFDKILAPFTKEKNIGVINASPLHMGLLVQKQKRIFGRVNDNKFTRAVAKASRYCEENETDIADLAMQFVYAYEGAATTLCGMSKVKNVERNLAAIGKKPDPEILSTVMRMISEGYDLEDKFGFADD